MPDLAELKALADQLPDELYKARCTGVDTLNGLCRDGADTEPHWWLDVQCGASGTCDICAPHLGTVLDIATHFKALVAECERLQAENEQLRRRLHHMPGIWPDEVGEVTPLFGQGYGDLD